LASTNPQVHSWIKLECPIAKNESNAADRLDEAYLRLVPKLVKAGLNMVVSIIDKRGMWGDNGFAEETVLSKGVGVPIW
jgi:hypothetical protein